MQSTPWATLWAGAAASIALAGVAMLADRRQRRRHDLDRVGLISWPVVLILALLAAAICAALAIRSG